MGQQRGPEGMTPFVALTPPYPPPNRKTTAAVLIEVAPTKAATIEAAIAVFLIFIAFMLFSFMKPVSLRSQAIRSLRRSLHRHCAASSER